MKNYSNYETRKVVITVDKNETLARIFNDNNEVVSKAVAKCNPEDTFDFKTGAELALARAFEKLPKPGNVEWKVVKRDAKPGDYVRIVAPCFTFDRIGDILKVNRVIKCDDEYCVIKVRAADHANRDKSCMVRGENYEWNYSNFEVEVVEPVTKEEWRVVNRSPKAGDYVRIKSSRFHFDHDKPIVRVHSVNDTVNVRNGDHPNARAEYIDDRCITDDYLWYYYKFEVEVVEPVKKEEFRKITRDPRPGDYIRLLKSCYDFDEVGDVLKIHEIVTPHSVSVLISDHPKLKKALEKESKGKWIADYWVYHALFDKFEFVEKVN